MNVSIYQNQPIHEAVSDNLYTVEQALETISCDLLVLPELFACGYSFRDKQHLESLSECAYTGQTALFLKQLAKKHQAHIVAGIPEKDGDHIYNSAIIVNNEGTVACYRKIHLFGFEKEYFTPGSQSPLVYTTQQDYTIGVMICFDWFFPEVARCLALSGADIICQPANLVLPYCQTTMLGRSIENRVFTITANRIGNEHIPPQPALTFTGKSQIVTPHGQILAQAPPDQACVISADIKIEKARDKQITKNNHLFNDRRPHLYSQICQTSQKQGT